MIAASPLSGCPLVEPATQHLRWPSDGKSNTIGSTVGVIMNHWGGSPCHTNPPVANADHHNDTNTHRNATESYPHPPNPPRPSGVTNVGPTTAIATHTHNLAEPLSPRRSRHHWPLQCTRARHRDGVDMPDAGLHPHEGDAQTTHTHRARAIVLCARSATHMSTM